MITFTNFILAKFKSMWENVQTLRLTSNRVISVELWLRVRVNDCQNPEFKILEGQNPEFNILAFKNPEFRILEFQNPEFKNFGLNLEFRISVWPFKILNSEFWPSKILNSGFGHSKILNSGFCNSNSVHVITMKITLTVAVPTMLKHYMHVPWTR